MTFQNPSVKNMHFTGYIPRKIPSKEAVTHRQKSLNSKSAENLALVVTTAAAAIRLRGVSTLSAMPESFSQTPLFEKRLDYLPFHAETVKKGCFQTGQTDGGANIPFLSTDGENFRGCGYRRQHGRL